MAEFKSMVRPTLVVSTALFRDGEVLLIKRGHEPFSGSWSFPGGRLKAGERLIDAAARELKEETGVTPISLHFVQPVEIIMVEHDILTRHIVLALFAGRYDSGNAAANDDAAELRWVSLKDIKTLHITQGLQNYAEAAHKKLLDLSQ